MKYDDAIAKANLTAKQALVLNAYLNGHSIRRIALANGWSEANARGHLDAAIRKIRPHMPKEQNV